MRVQNYTLFVTKNGRAVRESSFAFTSGPSGSYVSKDITVLSEHITTGGIIAMAWAKNPYSVVYMVLGNGNLISLVFNPEQEVRGWSRHDLGADGLAKAICVIPNGTGDWDDVYVVVQRTAIVNSVDVVFHTIERLEQVYANTPDNYQYNAFYVDCGSTLNNAINATLLIGVGATVAGTTDVGFQAGSAVFSSTDVGRFIHYDYSITQVGDDGLPFDKAVTAIAEITEYVSPTLILATINVAFPRQSITIAANTWRLTVTQIDTILLAWVGQTISILADGACQPDQVVSDDATAIELQYPASVVQVGLKSPSVFQTMKPAGGAPDGPSIGKIKRNIRATVRYIDSLGMEIGRDIDNLIEIDARPPSIPNDDPPPINSGDTDRMAFDGEWDREGRVMIVQSQPLPLTLCAVAMAMDVQPDG